MTDDISVARILVVNTCAFLNSARSEAIETILDCAAQKNANLEKLVVTGCLPQKFIGELYEQLPEVDVFLGTKDYNSFFDFLEAAYRGKRVNAVGAGCGQVKTDRVVTTPSHYAYLKIADGCNNKCTYCLIPKIRGKYESYSVESLVEEAEKLGEIAELILVAQDVTRYGTDLYGRKELKNLLKQLSALDNIGSIRLLYCYPDMIDDEIIEEIRDNSKILKYLDIPLQHSENRILRLMNRKGAREDYISLIEKLRENIPGIALRSTFIAGFPCETEDEFHGLCDFLSIVRLDNCGFFGYSKEPDTAAAKLKGQIPSGVKKRRVSELYKTQSRISAEKLAEFKGKILRVLCDGIDYDRNCFVGRAYFQAPEIDGNVYFNALSAKQGEYYDVLIENCDSYDLYGRCGDYEL